jgi:hypothetical protein
MTRTEDLIRRLGEEQPLLGERELVRMARAAASTERVPPRPRGRTGTRTAATAAAAAAILAATVAGSMLEWNHGSSAHSTASSLSGPYVQFSALALLTETAGR